MITESSSSDGETRNSKEKKNQMLAVILEFSAVIEEAVSLTGYPSREELTVWLVCLTFCFPFTNETMSCRKSFQIPPS